ncbi:MULTISPECIES: addiction module antidote protein [unclassified Pseudomonas]|uniref:addiction module antidote protein n=1 Tax=unclassified Pseudomonas TaxID=196821 RepID=UPI001F209B3C|nr:MULTISPECIES: addiction module antidote protein [unclassified Pseudomonas]MCF5230641.1 putative addiction module antidote protein [Pseudomonas sp. PA-5-4H]MCF5238428.1 putative addiction module antidote protein [Pseudomonas sp. PA-5-4G]MCF5247594.1 putative addiction module antidote protein [Pseudomonas sp. PA-5-4B]MCF5255653.1 putative addiction module antidote protein [Pseudomonas sp. PA-5-4B]MCF5260250.1 putative addiction module antidote protein [Pseudomonas sp. PA-5-4A]
MAQTLTTFDMAELLDSDEAISEYLSQVLADGDNEEFLRAVGYVAKARGMTKIATDAGVGRESLYKAFAPGAKPRFETVLKVLHSLGIDLLARPGHTSNYSIV